MLVLYLPGASIGDYGAVGLDYVNSPIAFSTPTSNELYLTNQNLCKMVLYKAALRSPFISRAVGILHIYLGARL